jgi:hypothetical protein
MIWNEFAIARSISLYTLSRKCLMLVDRCNWTGHECDVLGVTNDLRIIDVEIKISRGDLKADARKDKWWRTWFAYDEHRVEPCPRPRLWPQKVWKHYYALPAEIWDDKLLDAMPSPMSGVLLLFGDPQKPVVRSIRRATPDRGADRIQPHQVMQIARLANLRMWDAYAQSEDRAAGESYWRQAFKRETGRDFPAEAA